MILIAFGANLPHPELGPPPATFNAALAELQAGGLTLQKRSGLYTGKAVGPGEQPDYMNAAARFSANLTPQDVMRLLLDVERKLGRVRDVRWGPRTLDMDLIAHGSHILPDVERWRVLAGGEDTVEPLVLPHPRAHLRIFVLRPLHDIAPDWRHPVLSQTATELLAELGENDLDVRPWA